jgi:hypothetical protein
MKQHEITSKKIGANDQAGVVKGSPAESRQKSPRSKVPSRLNPTESNRIRALNQVVWRRRCLGGAATPPYRVKVSPDESNLVKPLTEIGGGFIANAMSEQSGRSKP